MAKKREDCITNESFLEHPHQHGRRHGHPLVKRGQNVDNDAVPPLWALSWPPTKMIPEHWEAGDYVPREYAYDSPAGEGTFVYIVDYGVKKNYPQFSNLKSFKALFPGPHMSSMSILISSTLATRTAFRTLQRRTMATGTESAARRRHQPRHLRPRQKHQPPQRRLRPRSPRRTVPSHLPTKNTQDMN